MNFNNAYNYFNKKNIYIIICLCIFSFFIFLGIKFSKERIFFDSGYRFFFILNVKEYCFSNNRIILFFQQTFIYLLSNFDFSLKTLLYIFSISDIPIFIIGLIYSFYIFKNNILFLLVPLGYFFYWGESYFIYPDLEIHLSALFILLLGINLIKDEPLSFYNKLVIYISTPILIFSHPISIIPCIFILYLIEQKHKKIINISFIIINVIVFFIRCLIADKYETNNVKNYWYNENNFSTFTTYLYAYITNHLSILVFILIALYYNRKNKKKLYSIICFILSYISSVIISGKYLNIEAYFILLGTTLLILTFEIISNADKKIQLYFTLFLLLFAIPTEIYSIVKYTRKYLSITENLNKMIGYTSHYSPHKLYIYSNTNSEYDQHSFQFTSSLIHSSLNSPDSSIILISEYYILEMIQIKNYLTKEDINNYYTECFQSNMNINNIKNCATKIFNEPHIKEEIEKQWFMNSINKKYFNIESDQFEFINFMNL